MRTFPLIAMALVSSVGSLYADGIPRKVREAIAAEAHPTPEQLGKGWAYPMGKTKLNWSERYYENRSSAKEKKAFRARTWVDVTRNQTAAQNTSVDACENGLSRPVRAIRALCTYRAGPTLGQL